MEKEWYVTFHGGAEPSTLNNIHVFSADGRKLRKALHKESLPRGLELRELRGMTRGPDGELYVANAFHDYSQILRFHGMPDKNGQHRFRDVFVQYDHVRNPGLLHPFNVVFDAKGDLYVTAQGTSVTLRYHGPQSKTGTPATTMPLPVALRSDAKRKLHPGTFCPSAQHEPEGLQVVREALFAHDLLYVSDRDADCVRKYDATTGAYRGRIVAKGLIDKPIHLALFDHTLYIGNRGNESVVRCDVLEERVVPFVSAGSGGLKNPSGLAVGGDGYFYVASRGSRQILRYHLEDGRPSRRPFIDGLPDDPEFIELMST